MREKLRKFIKVLRIELEDLEEDLRLMADLYNLREKRAEITEYVFLENMSLLKSQISGIEHILKSIDSIETQDFGTLDDLVEYVSREFKAQTEDAGFPESVYELVKRKLTKVSKYVQSAEE